MLQVAATQGLLGVAAYVGLLAAFVIAWWRGRGRPGAAALLGAWLAYQLPLQLDFSWLPSAAPAWLLMAVALAVWRDAPRERAAPASTRSSSWARLAGGVGAAAGLTALLAASVGMPLAADARFRAALVADARGQRAGALGEIDGARRLAPWQGVYAANAGDLLLDLRPGDTAGPHARPAAARRAYLDARRLGDARPEVGRRLAVTEAGQATG